MNIRYRTLLLCLVALSVAAISIVCLHSLAEIHYLKSFFPPSLTVQEAYYAGALELIKVAIISLPLVLVIVICLVFLRRKNAP